MAGPAEVSVDGGPGVSWDTGYVNPSSCPGFAGAYNLWYFDGTTSTMVAANVSGFSVGDDASLYALRGFRIIRIAPVTHGVTLAALVGQVADETNTALCILPGSTQAVVGTSDSRLKLVDLPG